MKVPTGADLWRSVRVGLALLALASTARASLASAYAAPADATPADGAPAGDRSREGRPAPVATPQW
ncbi:hypothetical protein GCM10023322_65680 [Rugosimonospora acidiphila]|uniref:Uncharacterized protein n=1 Tax=Rugosimonospora acidiphila TaxID=556531 RepID=A0ABP9SHM8_9ACTN